jgi:ABC-2 type transport system ATP-binding protein
VISPVLEFHNVSRAFKRGVPVLNGVTFSVSRGEVVGLLGRNGAGKTTLINIAMGMLYPHDGEVRAFGTSPTKNPVEAKRRIGYVSEDQILPPWSNIAEITALHRKLFAQWDHKLEKELLDRFGLARNSQRIGKLSKGQARQVALLCAVCHRPELLILDEPAGGLDPVARREFLETSIQMLNREGTAILFSSHHMGDVERMGGRVVLLDEGKVLIDAEVDSLRESYCVAILPHSTANEDVFNRLNGCIRVRAVGDELHAVFRGDPPLLGAALVNASGGTRVQCTTVPLEELFIELVGEDRAAKVA